RTLSPHEAIGENTCRDDFPLLKGKEVMVEATFRGSKGQAYTDMPGDFKGSIKDILDLPLSNNFQRAVFIATLNAVMRHFDYISKTIHCKDKEPELCAEQLSEHIKKLYGDPKIAFVGFQPAMLDKLSRHFHIRVVDLDEDNIGKEKYGIIIEGPEKTDEVLSWCDIILATGSTSVNKTIKTFLDNKPVIFYGVTVAGIAEIFGCERYCPCAH
ncbi:MAG: hypothetical protein K6348_04230, partial [Deferribacterales bacterium]